MKKSDALRRTGRTGTQVGFPATIIATLAVFDLIHWTPEQVSAVLTLSTLVWSYVQNYLESKTGRSFLIKK